MRLFNKVVGAFVAAGAAGSAVAQAATGSPALDVSGVTATMTNQLTSLTAVGGGILGVVVLIAAIAWMRRPIH